MTKKVESRSPSDPSLERSPRKPSYNAVHSPSLPRTNKIYFMFSSDIHFKISTQTPGKENVRTFMAELLPPYNRTKTSGFNWFHRVLRAK